MNQHSSQHPRRGFTLVELLIVISIIAILMSLSVVLLGGLLDQAEEEATSATIQKINRLMEQRIEAFDRAFKGARRDTAVNLTRLTLQDPNTDGDTSDGIFGVSEASLEILAKKSYFRFEFPQRFEDRVLVNYGDGSSLTTTLVPGLPNSVYVAISAPAARATLGLPDTTPLDDPAIVAAVTTQFANHAAAPWTESSELLYFALLKSGSYGAAAVDGDRFTDQEIRDTDNDGLPEFIDAWGQPLRFYRWPTRLIDIDAPVPFQPVLTDLADPTDVPPRTILPVERDLANLLMKGLPPAPSVLPNGALPRDLLMTDPDDPIGRLYAEMEKLDGTNGKPLLSSQYNELGFHTPDTFHAPLIVSPGPDEKLGLYEPNDTLNLGNLAAFPPDLDANGTPLEVSDLLLVQEMLLDNLTSRNKLSGGRQ
jgi:prepilin-type N-terminal cleavage/methylation domain-containing protein